MNNQSYSPFDLTQRLAIEQAIQGIFAPIINAAVERTVASIQIPAPVEVEKPLKIHELALILDVSTETVAQWEKQGLIPCRWLSNRKYYLISEVTAAMRTDPRFARKNSINRRKAGAQ